MSLVLKSGSNEIFFGLRSHPGWRFGLHAAPAATNPNAGLITPGTFTDDAAFTNSFLAFARNGATAGITMPAGRGALSVAAFHGAAQYGQRRDAGAGRTTGALAEYRIADAGLSGVALQAGWMMEPERLAGSHASGAFGELGAVTAFTGSLGRIIDSVTTGPRLAARTRGVSRSGAQYHGMLHDLSSPVDQRFYPPA